MLRKLTFVLLVIGGLNWLLVGLVGWDVGMIFGGMDAMISKIIYILVGLSAIVQIFSKPGHKMAPSMPSGSGMGNM